MKEIIFYKTKSGDCPCEKWLDALEKSTRLRITQRIQRLTDGNRGDWKRLDAGLYELRLDFGKGYRIYYIEATKIIILLLCGGDKSTQDTDIKKAKRYLKEIRDSENES